MSIGILNLEWTVFPQGNNKAAKADEATGRTILPWDRNAEIIVLYKYVFPVPP